MKQKKHIDRLCGWLLSASVALSLHLSPFTLQAQESPFSAVCQRHAVLPADIEAMAVVDSDLYCYASGVLLKATRNGETISALLPDTSLIAMVPDATFVVRHPSGDLYATKPDRKGRSSLMRLQSRDGRKMKASQVKMDGMTVEHPTFTTDGRVMVFASRDGNGNGGYDMWYSLFDGQSWGKPINLGSRLNTNGDEFSPTIHNEYLFFTSNGRDEQRALYATRLITTRITGDTIGMIQIGRSPVQRLPEPLNDSRSDNFDLAFDTINGCCYWVSSRTGSQRLFSFAGTLDGVVLWGYVKNKFGKSLPGVKITATSDAGDKSPEIATDSNGFYRMFLMNGRNYTISYRLEKHFPLDENITTPKSNPDKLLTESQHEVIMDGLPLGQRIYFDDLFGPNADLELSEHGKRQLQPLVRFLVENPLMSVSMSLRCNLTDDETFNRLLAQQRLQSLQNYLYSLVPASVKMRFTIGDSSDEGSTAGVSRLTTVITEK